MYDLLHKWSKVVCTLSKVNCWHAVISATIALYCHFALHLSKFYLVESVIYLAGISCQHRSKISFSRIHPHIVLQYYVIFNDQHILLYLRNFSWRNSWKCCLTQAISFTAEWTILHFTTKQKTIVGTQWRIGQCNFIIYIVNIYCCTRIILLSNTRLLSILW